MEKRKWLWKRKSSERSPGETESSGSISSYSERFSDDQDGLKTSPNNNSQSPEVTSKALGDEDANDRIKSLTERLSAALINVSAKDDLVKQHAKVAEEAIAGWEKAENEAAALKKQLEGATRQNFALEDRVINLDGALKECVRQLRQAREEHEEKTREAVAKRTLEWESTKSELENQLLEFRTKAEATKAESVAQIHPDILRKLEYLGQENASLRLELLSLSEELEVRTIERDLSTHAAETASKQHLEGIKKASKLEAECRMLKSLACKSSTVNDHRTYFASSTYVDSLTDSQSDSGERLNSVEVYTRKTSCSDPNKCEPSCSDSCASALTADQFKNEKPGNRNQPALLIALDLMDDFLEMERLAALPETEKGTNCSEEAAVSEQSIDGKGSLRAELEIMVHRTAELEEKLRKMEEEKIEFEEKLEKMKEEKAELEMALTNSQETNEKSRLQLKEAQLKLEELREELSVLNVSKKKIESQLGIMEVEARTMSDKVTSIEAELEEERALSIEKAFKCWKLEEELSRKKQEIELQQTASSHCEPKIKQEDLAVAAGKLAECQKTIASLGQQLKSLATLEDFLIDTASIPELSAASGSLIATRASGGGGPWKLHCNDTFSPKKVSSALRMAGEVSSLSLNKNEGDSLPPSSFSSTVSSKHVCSEKNRIGFANFFSRSKNGLQLEL